MVLAADKAAPAKKAAGPVKSVVTLFGKGVKDQDDMCFWKHPTDPTKSLVIGSDKYAGRLVVYDLEGKVLPGIAALNDKE